MSYDYDGIIAAAKDENGLLPTMGAQRVLVAVLRVIDAVDEAWTGVGVPSAGDYVRAVEANLSDTMANTWPTTEGKKP